MKKTLKNIKKTKSLMILFTLIIFISSCNTEEINNISPIDETKSNNYPANNHSEDRSFPVFQIYNGSSWVNISSTIPIGSNSSNTSSTGGVVDVGVNPQQSGFNWSNIDTSMILANELTLQMPPVGNQGSQGSCVSWACTYTAGSYIKHKTLGSAWSYLNASNTAADFNHLLSPAYTFNQLTNGCNGTTLYQTLNLLKLQGAPSLTQFPYNQNNCTTQPTPTQTNAALNNRINGFKEINNKAYIRWAIHYGYPVVFLALLDQSFGSSSSLTSDGFKIWKANTTPTTSYHAMCVIGYSNIRQAYLVQNSWGSSWGNSGKIWIDYNWFNQVVATSNSVYPKLRNRNNLLN